MKSKTKFASALLSIIGVIMSCFISGCNRGYVVDKKRNIVFWESYTQIGGGIDRSVIANADVATFEEIKVGTLDSLARDKEKLYHKWRVVLGADPNSFTTLETGKNQGEFYRDARHVFRYSGYMDRINILPDSDPETFSVINDAWSRDAKRVYLYDSGFEPRDIESFEPLVRIWARDNKAYYWGTRELTDADKDSFRISKEQPRFAFDKNHVFWHGWIIEECDPKTFRIEGIWEGSDDHFSYKFKEIWDDLDASYKKIEVHRASLK